MSLCEREEKRGREGNNMRREEKRREEKRRESLIKIINSYTIL